MLQYNTVRLSKPTIQLLIIKHHPDIAKLLGTLPSVMVETFLQPITPFMHETDILTFYSCLQESLFFYNSSCKLQDERSSNTAV